MSWKARTQGTERQVGSKIGTSTYGGDGRR